MKRFLFITTTNLASNPRLLKELRLAVSNGYEATVIQFSVGNWSDGATELLKKEFSGTRFIELSALRKPFFPWFLSSVLQKICTYMPLPFMGSWMLSMSAGKRTWLLLQQLKRITSNYDWVIAHNPAAFYPALVFAKKHKCQLGIDVEDYHPGETNDTHLSSIMIKLMQKTLPKAAYCSYASPLIKKEVHSVVRITNGHQFIIINGFDQKDFTAPAVSPASALKMVWFSQYIDFGRGLEKIIPVINSLYPEVELHLVGNLRADFAKTCLQNTTGIVLHDVMNQQELHRFLAGFDVGLAVEPGKDLNNQLAVSNKLIAYLQAGLLPVVSATDAQLVFLANHQLSYQLLPKSEELIRAMFLQLIASKEKIRDSSKSRFLSGKEFDWRELYEPLRSFWNQQV